EEKPSEESPRERFPRPGVGERPATPSMSRPTAKPEEKPLEQRARPAGIPPTGEHPGVQRRFTPAPRRTQPFVLDEDTADELDTELEYVDFDEETQPPSDDED
ncbi:MAG: hypothetical protein K8I82_01705, partial [Anaerolineae bacterium]|nr:hypothetical protein [Anaerolineae bacterium]